MSIFECFDAAYGGGLYESVADGLGGLNIMHDGIVVDHMGSNGVLDSAGMGFSFDNLEGGTDIIVDGKTVSHSVENIFGGMDTYEGTDLVSTSMPNMMDGVDIYGDDMSFEGFTTPNVLGGENFISFDNTMDMLSFDDPLAHAAEFRMDPLVF